MKDGTHGTHADAVDGPLLLSAKNIKDGTVKWDESDRRISQEEYEKIHSNFSLKTGDVLLTIVGSIGEAAILKDNEGVTFQRSVAFLRPKEDILSDFLYTEIQTPTFQKELESRKSTSAQPGIYLGDLSEIPLKYSPSLDEQKKIGEYFRNLDNLITLHQRQYYYEKKQPYYIIYICVIKNIHLFFDFIFITKTFSWEQRKLGEFADIVTGKLDANAMKEDGEYDFYTSGIQKYKIDVPAFEGPAITIAGNGATVGYMHLADGKFNAYQRTYVLSAFQANREFLFYEIGNKLPQKIAQEARTGNIPYIVMNMLTDLQISLPLEQEQSKIGEFLMNLDNLITLHQL